MKTQLSWSACTLIFTVIVLVMGSLSDRLSSTWNNPTLIKADQIQLVTMTDSLSDEYNVDGFAVAVKDTYVNRRIVGTKLVIAMMIVVTSLIFWIAEKRRNKKESNMSRQ